VGEKSFKTHLTLRKLDMSHTFKIRSIICMFKFLSFVLIIFIKQSKLLINFKLEVIKIFLNRYN